MAKKNARHKPLVQPYLPIEGADPHADMEQITRQTLLEACKIEGRYPQVMCIVHSFRIRLCDPDGIAAKYFIDSIVKAGVLRDDNLTHLQAVFYKQTKVKTPEEEMTVIELWKRDEQGDAEHHEK